MDKENFQSRIENLDCREGMKSIPDGFVDLCVTSPPYYMKQGYGHIKQIFDEKVECDHQWNWYIRKGICGGKKSRVMNIKGHINSCIVDDDKQAFCKKCNAWIGTFGLEPSYKLYVDHLMQIVREIKRVLSDKGSFFLNIKDTYVDISLCGIPELFVRSMLDDGWLYRNTVIWDKDNFRPENVKNRFTNSHEFVYFFVKNKKYFFNQQMDGNHNMRNVWRLDTDKTYSTHLAGFPKDLVEIIIKACTKKGDIVLDPFMGYATTAFICDLEERRYIGYEINKDYHNESLNRLSNIASL